MEIEHIIPSLWHAFTALDGQQTGNGLKQQLKVLGFNIASVFGVRIEKENLENYRPEGNVTFEDFRNFLEKEVIEPARKKKSGDQNANTLYSHVEQVNDTCWLVCRKYYCELANDFNHAITREDLFKIWCIFNALCEISDDDKHELPIHLHRDELALLVKSMLAGVGKMFEPESLDEIVPMDTENVDFLTCWSAVENLCCRGVDSETITAMVKDLYAEHILGVLKKGFLEKKAPSASLRQWTNRWFALTAKDLSYYTDRCEKDCRGVIYINKNVRAGSVSLQEKGKSYRFRVATENRTYELGAADAKTRQEWLNCLHAAIEFSHKPYGPQKLAWLKRRSDRKAALERKLELDAQSRGAQDMIERQKKELEEARRAQDELQTTMEEELRRRDEIIARLREIEEERKQLEQQLSQEANRRDSFKRRLQALEQEHCELKTTLEKEIEDHVLEKERNKQLAQMKAELEARLAEEEQARRDEEIVRKQAALALREELEKREQLEQLQREHEEQLATERHARHDLEQLRYDQELQLQQERDKLAQLKLDREKKDLQLQEAMEKITSAERAKQDVEKKVKNSQNPEFRRLLMERIYQEHLEGTPEINSHRGKGAFTPGEFEAIGKVRKADLERKQSTENSVSDTQQKLDNISLDDREDSMSGNEKAVSDNGESGSENAGSVSDNGGSVSENGESVSDNEEYASSAKESVNNNEEDVSEIRDQ